MALDEAIKHAEEVTGRMFNDRMHYIKCAGEHQQLAEWLKELKQLREKFIQILGINAWQQMIVFAGLAEQFKEYWTSPYNEMDCRDCKEFEDCPCGKDGHESGTSQGYSIGECKDFEPQESEDGES